MSEQPPHKYFLFFVIFFFIYFSGMPVLVREQRNNFV